MATKSERDDRPRTKKKKKQPSRAGLWIGLSIGGGVFVFVVAVAVVIIVIAPWNQAGANKKVDHAQENQNPPPGKLGGEVVKEPNSLLGNIRRRADEVGLKNEMIQVLTFFEQYSIDVPNPNTRKVDGFLDFFKKDSNKIYAAIKDDKYYTVNVRARNGSDDILIYESEPYSDGYFCLRANKQFEKVPAQTLKAAGLPTK